MNGIDPDPLGGEFSRCVFRHGADGSLARAVAGVIGPPYQSGHGREIDNGAPIRDNRNFPGYASHDDRGFVNGLRHYALTT
jgi:hypothetical protein